MDDFGDFFQAPPVAGTNQMRPSAPSGTKRPVDLNSKILSSFDLSGSNQKATFKFQQPSRHTGKRPQGSNFKQSSSSADWKNINLENEFMAPIVPQQQSFVPQAKPIPGNMLLSGQNQALNADLMGLAVGNSATPVNLNVGMPQMVHGYQHSVQNRAIGLTGDWQYNAQHPITATGNQFSPLPSSHIMNPNQDNRGGNILPAHHQSNKMTEAHPSKVSGSATGTFYGGSFTQPHGGIIHPQNSRSPINLLARQEIPSVETRNRSHTEHYQSTSGGSSLPSWMTDPNQIPPVYKQVLKITATNNSFADTNLLYPIFLSSELPKDILGHIWTVANQSSPGKLTYTEVYTALALIALAQTGEMDLSTRYVLKLQTAPIPQIQIPQGNSSGLGHPVITAPPNYKIHDSSSSIRSNGSFNQILDIDSMQHSQPSKYDAFADFQSFTVPQPSAQNMTPKSSTFVKNEIDMSSFPSPVSMPVGRESVVPHYPDRDLINSPKHTSTDISSHESPKQLLGGIDFNKFKDKSSSKVLHSAAKKLNISKRSVAPAPVMDDDFADFKSAESFPTTMTTTSSKNDIQRNSGLAFMQLNTRMETNEKFAALHMVDSVAQQTIGLKLESSVPMDNNDKYAVFRDIELSNNTEHSGCDEFADFQSVESQRIPVTQPLPSLNDGSNTTLHSDVKKAPISEDILSISSLELPSLSKTILNNSIGTTATSESSNIFGLPTEGNLHFASSVPNVSGKVTSPDDGLYDLDEPITISPVYQRKQVIVSPTKPEAPKIDSSSVIRNKISNLSDSDFADFSAGPPPIDDDIDQHDTEYGLDEGDSSLVDFDAFGHFEEAKIEVQKKKESAFKRTREDATAFSEFVKSSVVDLKPAHPHESSATSSKQDTTQCTEEDSSVTENKCYKIDDSEGTLSFSVNSNAEEGSSVITGWKLEPSCPEVQSNKSLGIGTSEWEEEGNELKARMEGSSNPMEIFTDHWSRCLATCKDIIVSTGDIFASLNSPSVCHEVVNSNRGKEFISCTSEVYGVSRRIRKGMETVGLDDEDLMSSIKEIEIAWNNLLGFCPYTPSVHKTPEHRICANTGKSSSACSLCLLDTESTEVSGLEYCGRFYHAPCANLWLNQIAPILPRLEAPASRSA